MRQVDTKQPRDGNAGMMPRRSLKQADRQRVRDGNEPNLLTERGVARQRLSVIWWAVFPKV